MQAFITLLKERARALKSETYAVYLASKDPRTPWYAKALVGVIVAYALSPIDLIPDFIPVLGYLDDLILVPLGIKWALTMIPDEVMRDCRSKALHGQAPKEWLAAAIIISIWIAGFAWTGWILWKWAISIN